MNRKYWIILIAVAVVSFILGFMVEFMITGPDVKEVQENEVVIIENQTIEVMVRVREGYVEWYDGTTWNRAQSVDELQAEDSYKLAQEDLKAFEDVYQATLESENAALVTEQSEVMSEPLVGSDKRPATTTQTTGGGGNTEQSVVANVPEQGGGGSSASGSSGGGSGSVSGSFGGGSGSASGSGSSTGGDSTTDSGSGGSSDSGTTTPPSDGGTTTTPSTPGTGDGEDIGWSDDYL